MLKKTCEPVLLKKMGLSVKFPQKILCARKSALGIGLLSPATIIDALALKLCLGHKRINDEVAKVIGVIEDKAATQHGHAQHLLQMKREFKPEQITQSDEIEQKISARQLKIINGDEINKRWTANKTIIEYAT